MPGTEQEGQTPAPTDGINIRFINSEHLREFILDPNKPGKVSFAERRAGIREIGLGKYQLDGALFESARFSLIIESSPVPEERTPTVIVRADLVLGNEPTGLALFQTAIAENDAVVEEGPWEESYLPKVRANFPEEPSFLAWNRYAGRITPQITAETHESAPLALLQVWERGTGPGSIAIALFTLGRYYTAWMRNYGVYEEIRKKGWEANSDSADEWNFLGPVGIPTHDPERFRSDIAFYERAFALAISAMYKVEGKPVPHAVFEIEPPSILKDEKRLTFKNIVGQENAVEFLQTVVWSVKSNRQIANRPLILLAGPPGNGKTTLAQATANELDAPLLVATTQSLPPEAQDAHFNSLLESGYLQAKAEARKKNGISVFCIEGIEAMLGGNLRLQDRFLNMMDAWSRDSDNEVIVIATTNLTEQTLTGALHPGILSRFYKHYIQPLKGEKLVSLISNLTGRLVRQVGRSDILDNSSDLEKVAKQLEQAEASGRDVLNFLTSAYRARRLESERIGHWLPMDTEFLLKHAPGTKGQGRLGFPIPPTPSN